MSSEIWDEVPEYAKRKYQDMRELHRKMCKGKIREPEEAMALRREMRVFYKFQCEAAKKRIENRRKVV